MARPLGGAALLLVALACLVYGSPAPAGAQAPTSLSVDALPGANSATSVQTVHTCASASVGDTFAVDVVVDSVSNLLGFDIYVTFDPKVLEVTGHDTKFLLAVQPGSNVQDLSGKLPQEITDSGHYLVQSLSTAEPGVPGASGSGVLARLDFKAKATGTSKLSLERYNIGGGAAQDLGPHLADVNGNAIGAKPGETLFSGPTNGAAIHVGAPCPAPDSGNVVKPIAATATPQASTAAGQTDGGGSNTGLIVAIIVAALAIVAAIAAVPIVIRRRRTQRP